MMRPWVRLDRRSLIGRVDALVEQVRRAQEGVLLVVRGADEQDRAAAADYVQQNVTALGGTVARIPLDDRQVSRPRDLLARAWKIADNSTDPAILPASLTSGGHLDVDTLVERIRGALSLTKPKIPVFIFDTVDEVDGLRREQTRCFQSLARRCKALVIVFSREESNSQWAPQVPTLSLIDLPLGEIAESLTNDAVFNEFTTADVNEVIDALREFAVSGTVKPADAYDIVNLKMR